MKKLHLTTALLLSASLFACKGKETKTLLNVSYDPTRELYQDVNGLFIESWKKSHDEDIKIDMSHGGSGKQARAVADGLKADVVTLALAGDIDLLAKQNLVDTNWQNRLPNRSSPYTSTIVFLVRKGNPKNIHSWADLVRSDVKVITPNPKTSGGARWAYLAAWGQKLIQTGSQDSARAYVHALYHNVPVLDAGARAASSTFLQRKQGDVLLSWENEAYLALKEKEGSQVEVITPQISILAEPPVSVVDQNAAEKGTAELAKAYLDFLYTPAAQEAIAKHHYRPFDPQVAAAHAADLPSLKLFTIDSLFGGWSKVQKAHFGDGGEFDRIFKK